MRVREDVCYVIVDGQLTTARYAPHFPTPRTERVSPGHVVALATAFDRVPVILWRWYDAVVVGVEEGQVRLWEPAHGEVLANPRLNAEDYVPGQRAYASAGLPGAEWWVCGPASGADHIDVERDEVSRLYTQHSLWRSTLEAPTHGS